MLVLHDWCLKLNLHRNRWLRKGVCLMFPDGDECLTSSCNDLHTRAIPPHPPTSCWRSRITFMRGTDGRARDSVFPLPPFVRKCLHWAIAQSRCCVCEMIKRLPEGCCIVCQSKALLSSIRFSRFLSCHLTESALSFFPGKEKRNKRTWI